VAQSLNWHIAIEPCHTQGLTKLGGQFARDFEHPVNSACGPAGAAAANNQRHTGSGARLKKLPPFITADGTAVF